MAKTKSKATVLAADGAGGLTPVHDRRFEKDDWPIRFTVAREQSDSWLQYLSAECRKRGWSCSSFGQMDAKENSGSITVSTNVAGGPQLAVVWERKRNGPIKIRARSAGALEFPMPDARELLRKVNEECRAGAKEQFYVRGQLEYEGLPWRGEFWLNDTLRLGPPSKQYETALIGPRVILVDAKVEGIDRLDASSAFAVMLRELAVFLSVAIWEVRVQPNGIQVWTWTADQTGKVDCETRNLGYYEQENRLEMPIKGQVLSVPLLPVQRPDFSLRGIVAEDNEQALPADITDLWQALTRLPPDRRRQFFQVGSMWQVALSLGHEYQTAGFTGMVSACEALKSPAPQFRDHNIYHVVEALLGKTRADMLQEEWFRPQNVRNAHLHRGEFRGSEFAQHVMMSSFRDPTFDQAWRVLAQITRAAIIEWLRLGGTFIMLPLKRRRSWRRWVKEHAFLVLLVGVAVGFVSGYLLSIYQLR